MNILTDLYLMAIPVPMVWKSHLHWRKKVTLTMMFSGGFLQIAFGALRCASILLVRSIHGRCRTIQPLHLGHN